MINEARLDLILLVVPANNLAEEIIPMSNHYGAGKVSASSKIGPLSFRQIFFKILQSEGTLENVPLASLILILKSISIFTELGQNEVTLKNASGWGKRIQLGILNLNQIGCRTGETILRGKDTFLSGEETFLSGKETFLSGKETFLSDKETFLSGEKTFLSGGETFLSDKETFLSGEKTFLSGEETFLSDEETFLSGKKTFLRSEETFLSGEETFLSDEETFLSGKKTFLRGEETFLGGKETFGSTEKTLERSNALCRQGNKGKIIIYIKYKRRQT